MSKICTVAAALLFVLSLAASTATIEAQSLQIWGFNSSGDLGGFHSQPSNGASNGLSQVGNAPYVSDGSGSLRIDYTGSVGFNTAVATSKLPPLPWDSIATIAADVYVPAQVSIGRLGLGIQIDGPPANKTDIPVHLLGVRGGWNHVTWPIHPGQLSGQHSFGFALDTDEPMTAAIYIDNVRGVQPEISVDAGQVISSFDPIALWGNNVAYYYPLSFFNDPSTAALSQDAGFYFFRIPGGLNTDVYHWNGSGVRRPDGSINPAARNPDGTWQVDYAGFAPGFEVKGEATTGDPLFTQQPDFTQVNALDHSPAADVNTLAHWVKGLGPQAQLMVDVNVGTASKLFATGANNTLQDSDVAVGARAAAEWVRYFNQRLGLHVKYWEVGNELNPYGAEIGVHIQDRSPQGWHWITAADYAEIFRAYTRAMKAADPSIKIAGPVGYFNALADRSGRTNWIETFLQLDGDIVDVLDVHFYDSGQTEAEYLAVPSNLESQIDAMKAEIRQLAPQRASQIGIGVSEWGDYNNLYPIGDGLFSADLMGQLVKSGATFGNAWDIGNVIPDNGALLPTFGWNAASNGSGGWTTTPANGASMGAFWTNDPTYTRPKTNSLVIDYRGSKGANASLSRSVEGLAWNPNANSLRVDTFIPQTPGNNTITVWLRIEKADGSIDDSGHDQLQATIWGQWNRILLPLDPARLANARRIDIVVDSSLPIATPLYFGAIETQQSKRQPNARYWAAYMYHHYFGNALVASSMGDMSRDRLAAYASRAGDGSLYLMVVNKDPSSDISIPVSLNGYGPASVAEVHSWSGANYIWNASAGEASVDTPPSSKTISVGPQFTYVFPKYSITAIKLSPG